MSIFGPPKPQKPPAPAVQRGLRERCPCPHCGRPNDFSDAQMVEAGATFSCDHCRRMMQVVKVETHTFVTVRPAPGVAGGGGALTRR